MIPTTVSVKGIEKVQREVQIELYPSQLYCATRAYILRTFGVLNVNATLNETGKLVSYDREGGGGHSWIEENVILEKPPGELVEALNAMRVLDRILNRKL